MIASRTGCPASAGSARQACTHRPTDRAAAGSSIRKKRRIVRRHARSSSVRRSKQDSQGQEGVGPAPEARERESTLRAVVARNEQHAHPVTVARRAMLGPDGDDAAVLDAIRPRPASVRASRQDAVIARDTHGACRVKMARWVG